MKFPRDEELFQNVPVRQNPRAYSSLHTTNSTTENAETICEVYNRCYEKAADEMRAAHKGSISDIYTQEEINKDFEKIAHKLNLALEGHLETTGGYIGEFPQSRQYYATVDKREDYYFDYLSRCDYDRFSLTYYLGKLNALVSQELFKNSAIKSALALIVSVVCIGLMWFLKGWFFIYEGLGIAKIAALTLVFVSLLALIWWSSHDPDEFASKNGLDESPAGYLGVGVVAAVLVRIFLSGSVAATVCCVAAAISGVCFLLRLLAACRRLRQIRNCSPALQKLSLTNCQMFEMYAQRTYRFVRFLELWCESENIDQPNKQTRNKSHIEALRRSLMKNIEEYEQWCSKYLRDSDDTGF